MRGGVTRLPKESKTFPDFGEGNCLYCGSPLPPRKRKYCREDHGYKYRYDISDYETISWAIFRDRMLERDNNICQDCGDPPEEVHHMLPLYKDGKEFDENNCTSLCKKCHVKRHRGRNTKMESGVMKQEEIGNF